MKPDSKPRAGAPPSAKDVDRSPPHSPQEDLQPAETGSAASRKSGPATASQAAMKQQSKTDSERGSGS